MFETLAVSFCLVVVVLVLCHVLCRLYRVDAQVKRQADMLARLAHHVNELDYRWAKDSGNDPNPYLEDLVDEAEDAVGPVDRPSRRLTRKLIREYRQSERMRKHAPRFDEAGLARSLGIGPAESRDTKSPDAPPNRSGGMDFSYLTEVNRLGGYKGVRVLFPVSSGLVCMEYGKLYRVRSALARSGTFEAAWRMGYLILPGPDHSHRRMTLVNAAGVFQVEPSSVVVTDETQATLPVVQGPAVGDAAVYVPLPGRESHYLELRGSQVKVLRVLSTPFLAYDVSTSRGDIVCGVLPQELSLVPAKPAEPAEVVTVDGWAGVPVSVVNLIRAKGFEPGGEYVTPSPCGHLILRWGGRYGVPQRPDGKTQTVEPGQEGYLVPRDGGAGLWVPAEAPATSPVVPLDGTRRVYRVKRSRVGDCPAPQFVDPVPVMVYSDLADNTVGVGARDPVTLRFIQEELWKRWNVKCSLESVADYECLTVLSVKGQAVRAAWLVRELVFRCTNAYPEMKDAGGLPLAREEFAEAKDLQPFVVSCLLPACLAPYTLPLQVARPKSQPDPEPEDTSRPDYELDMADGEKE